MESDRRLCPLEPGTPAGVSRRLFLRTVGAGSAGALAAGGVREAAAARGAGGMEALAAAQADAVSDAEFWATVRGEFLISDELAYMNSGTLGPMPKPVYYAVVDGYRALAADPGRENSRHNAAQGDIREKLAAFVNGRPDRDRPHPQHHRGDELHRQRS